MRRIMRRCRDICEGSATAVAVYGSRKYKEGWRRKTANPKSEIRDYSNLGKIPLLRYYNYRAYNNE